MVNQVEGPMGPGGMPGGPGPMDGGPGGPMPGEPGPGPMDGEPGPRTNGSRWNARWARTYGWWTRWLGR
ncbi:MAG: hypothetical protein CM15mP114_07300 [Alphaproteobacteria bacterium]|nr:MAG: hypothetical protein CM15mP114_07300 [Alphaproteobacteria bacterium]